VVALPAPGHLGGLTMGFLPCVYSSCLGLLWIGCQASHPVPDDAATALDAATDVAVGVDSGAPDDDAGTITNAPAPSCLPTMALPGYTTCQP
jgi:hypothetical protein